jgi:hypothetical protein
MFPAQYHQARLGFINDVSNDSYRAPSADFE